MEPIKLTTIGHYVNPVLTMYQSVLNGDMLSVLINIDYSLDPNFTPNQFEVEIGERHNRRFVKLDTGLPFLKNMSEVGEVQDVGRAIREFCAEQTDPVRDCGRLWYFAEKLIWASRGARSLNDYELICLRIEEHVHGENEEVLRLKKKVARLRKIIENNFQEQEGRVIDDSVYAFVLQRDNEECVLCKSTEELQFDHILPKSRGGNDEPENLRVLCRTCNLKRGNLKRL